MAQLPAEILAHRDEILQIAARHGTRSVSVFGSLRKAQSGLSAKRKTGHPCSPYAHPFRSQTHRAPTFLCFALQRFALL